ncbi:MAG TPA: hypothetical protein VMX58_09475 [Patescibacteria group bacterium]|nr:hypothetical protein [Patescibacteria group bacterium]
MQVSSEKTIFMQKAIYFVSRLIAARGILELTDRCINFQVSPLDASFGMKNLSIDLCSITDISLEERDLRPKVVITAGDHRYEFILSQGKKLHAKIKQILKNSLTCDLDDGENSSTLLCSCGKKVNSLYHYCPWCGKKL